MQYIFSEQELEKIKAAEKTDGMRVGREKFERMLELVLAGHRNLRIGNEYGDIETPGPENIWMRLCAALDKTKT